MPRRTQRQIELDCKRIQEVAKKATCMKEVALATGLSQSEINTSLKKHPIIFKRVLKQLEENKVLAELPTPANDVHEKKMPEVNNVQTVPVKEENDFKFGFVVDTSMVEIMDVETMLSQICATDAVIIMTSVVRKELNKMQRIAKDYKAFHARRIMAMAAEIPEKFYYVSIDETLETADDCIVKFCVEHKKRVVLLTADKHMAIDAREKSVKVEFFKANSTEVKSITEILSAGDKAEIRTLNPAKKLGNKLVISEMKTAKREIRVWSKGEEFSDGIVQLKIGDDVFIASRQKYGIAFAHYRMITLFEEYNCKQLYFIKIQSDTEIEKLPDERYKAFAREIWNRKNFKKFYT